MDRMPTVALNVEAMADDMIVNGVGGEHGTVIGQARQLPLRGSSPFKILRTLQSTSSTEQVPMARVQDFYRERTVLDR